MQAWGRVGDCLETHNARTPEELRLRHAQFVQRQNETRPIPGTPGPWVTLSKPRLGPLVEQGRWRIACAHCDGWCSYTPAWKLSICFECGATYNNLEVATSGKVYRDDHEREAHLMAHCTVADIEAVMLAIPRMVDRNWKPTIDAEQGVVLLTD